jgi:hypothetical protein
LRQPISKPYRQTPSTYTLSRQTVSGDSGQRPRHPLLSAWHCTGTVTARARVCPDGFASVEGKVRGARLDHGKAWPCLRGQPPCGTAGRRISSPYSAPQPPPPPLLSPLAPPSCAQEPGPVAPAQPFNPPPSSVKLSWPLVTGGLFCDKWSNECPRSTRTPSLAMVPRGIAGAVRVDAARRLRVPKASSRRRSRVSDQAPPGGRRPARRLPWAGTRKAPAARPPPTAEWYLSEAPAGARPGPGCAVPHASVSVRLPTRIELGSVPGGFT